jgi:hypothetical protein
MNLVALHSAKKQARLCERGELTLERVGRLTRHASDLAHVIGLAGMQEKKSQDVPSIGTEEQIGQVHRIVAIIATIVAQIATSVLRFTSV